MMEIAATRSKPNSSPEAGYLICKSCHQRILKLLGSNRICPETNPDLTGNASRSRSTEACPRIAEARSKGTQVSGHHSPCAAKVGGSMNNPLAA